MEEVLLDPVDFRVFPEYILPFFFEKIFYEESSFLVEKQSCCELTILTIIRNIGIKNYLLQIICNLIISWDIIFLVTWF